MSPRVCRRCGKNWTWHGGVWCASCIVIACCDPMRAKGRRCVHVGSDIRRVAQLQQDQT